MMDTLSASKHDFPVCVRQTLFALAGLLCLLSADMAIAHENNFVHAGLTRAAIRVADIPEITAYGFFDITFDPQCSSIEEGSVKEDMGCTPEYLFCLLGDPSWILDLWGAGACGVDAYSYRNHSYNPITGRGWEDLDAEPVIEDTLTYAAPIWEQSLLDYAYGRRNRSYFGLGRVCHLLEDMSSPAHVHGDLHIAIPLIDDSDDFEDWGPDNFNEESLVETVAYIPSGSVTLPDGREVDAESIEGFVHSMASFTYDLSAFQGHLISAEDTQPDCELARMFPSLHYYDGGILGDDYWEIEDVGRFGTLLDQWWACDGDHDEFTDPDGVHHIVGNFYIENSAGYSDELTPAVFEKTGVYEANPNYKTLTQIYGDVLYRQTVSYVAGLFNVFAVSAVELPAPQPDVKVNGSDETVGVSKGDSFDIAISLDPGYAAGQEADWLFAILYYDQNLGEWTVYHYAQYRAALFDMGPEFATLDTSGVPDEGLALLFFFAIGLDLDGSYDFSDTALVYIQPNAL